MRYTVDDKLLQAAAAVLGTSSPERTIEASLRRTVDAVTSQRADRAGAARQVALDAVTRRLHTPPDAQELARRRAAGAMMGQVRVPVGRDFDIAEELRQMRARSELGLPPDVE